MSTLYCHFNFNHVRLSLDNKRLLIYLLWVRPDHEKAHLLA